MYVETNTRARDENAFLSPLSSVNTWVVLDLRGKKKKQRVMKRRENFSGTKSQICESGGFQGEGRLGSATLQAASSLTLHLAIPETTA